mgnify:CR=1 FL=1
MNIKLEQFKELIDKGLSLDLIYVLQKISEGVIIKQEKEYFKVNNIVYTLERKGYITHENIITLEGKELLDSLKTTKIKTKRFPKRDEEFEQWWKTYPGTTEFVWKGRRFAGSRAIRIKKEECRSKFEKILDEGILGEDMVKALECEITQKKEESLKRNENKLNYMQNTLTYLNQRTFEPYIELVKENIVFSSTTNSVDI